MKYEYTRVAEDAPNRCQAVTANGQCYMAVVEGSKFCPFHGGNKSAEPAKKLHNYRLARWRARMEELADNSKIKSLREEIGILRILMEETINKCDGPIDLLRFTPQISDLAMKIERIVTSCHKLEHALGDFLDRNEAMQLGAEIGQIVSEYVNDPAILDAVMTKIADAITREKDVES